MRKTVLFACDLDGTLLVSARHAREGDAPAECVDGAVRSYWPAGMDAAIRGLPPDVAFVPVTSRSVAQYARLSWPDWTRPVMAVVTNGGTLLDHGREFPLLVQEPDQAVLSEAARALSKYPGLARVVDGRYAYLHLDAGVDPETVSVRLPPGVRLLRAGRKFYCVPSGVDKETAFRTLAAEFGARYSYAAGDGSMDAGMLSEAGTALVPNGGVPGLARRGRTLECPSGMRFQDFVVSVLASFGNRA